MQVLLFDIKAKKDTILIGQSRSQSVGRKLKPEFHCQLLTQAQ